MAPKTKTRPAPEEEEDLELEDLDEDVEEEPKGKKGAAQEIEFGVKDLCDYIEKKTGKKYSTRDMRTLIRKMAREDKPRVKRDIVAGNRTRYDWAGGLENPEVKRIIKAVTGGEVEAGRKEALDKLKENKAKKDAAKKGKKGKKAKAPEPEEEDLEDIEDEVDEDEDDE